MKCYTIICFIPGGICGCAYRKYPETYTNGSQATIEEARNKVNDTLIERLHRSMGVPFVLGVPTNYRTHKLASRS